MKKASSRSQRGSKGIKGKHILQICVLLGVCIWLIYQVKYSHDKKKEFYEKDGDKSTVLSSESKDGLVKLGRKDLLPGYHNQNEKEKHVEEDDDEEEKESKSKVENGNHEEEEKEEEEEAAEEDEEEKNKQGEEVPEEDEDENKHEEDEIDEQDRVKTGGDTDEKGDELFEEEKEGGSNERDEKEKDTVDEAREEHYKADDASSAVSHEARVLKTEKLKESPETAQENNANATAREVEAQKEPVLKSGEAESGDSVEKATKDSEPSISETKSAVTESTGETVHGNSTEAILEASGFLKNETEIMQERSQEDGTPELQTVSKLEQTLNGSDPNITNKDYEFKNSTSETSVIENISGLNTTEVNENSRSEGDDEIGEKESANLFSAEQMEDTDDTPETTILQEEREALTDPQTLPDIRIEGNEEDEEEAMAAE
ncbi:unnamed protein product [Microthlaspi erraticum]|uniref:Uncharacterized protein n=1 Tax=Microthlaspi erraticum TaxID=1685480 RepID=A0A6D2JDH5_9BRAS|nr:unnamed protein product [Microthlaspi erraticum]